MKDHICLHQDLLLQIQIFKDEEVKLVTGIWGQVSPLGIVSIKLNIKDDEGNTHQETFREVYYLPQSPKVLIIPQKWSTQRMDDVIGKEVTRLTIIGRQSII